jgi:hypothetical protein
MAVFNPFDFFLEPYAEKIPFTYAADERKELAPYLETLPLTPKFKAYLEGIDRTPLPAVDFLVAPQSATERRHRLPDPHGTGRANARAHP